MSESKGVSADTPEGKQVRAIFREVRHYYILFETMRTIMFASPLI